MTVDASDLDIYKGVLLTTPVRTIYDCARWLAPAEALVVAESFLQQGLLEVDQINAYRAGHPGIRNVTRVDALLHAIEPLSESPMETRLRHLLVAAGLPRPIAQYVVRDPVGSFVARLDLAYPGVQLAVEYDGALHWEQRREDDRRRDRVRALGWTVLVVSSSDLREAADSVVVQVRALLSAAA